MMLMILSWFLLALFPNFASASTITGFCVGFSHSCVVYDYTTIKCAGMKAAFGASELLDDNIGQEPEELGDSLPSINVGTNTTIEQISCGGFHTCMKLGTGDVKCLGLNSFGYIGAGDVAYSHGEASGYIGDNLPIVNLGMGFVALEVVAGLHHTGVLSTEMKLKCFGRSQYGQLGYGNRTTKGYSTSHMGDNLPFVDFGANILIESVTFGVYHSCVILHAPVQFEKRIKCWGFNMYYQLGYGDQNNRGDEATEMGDNLLLVDLGTESRVKQLALGLIHTCALLFNDILKCIGSGFYGQLGSGSSDIITLAGNAMSSVLIDSGKGVNMVTAGRSHTCVVYDDMITMKCVGSNQLAQLGQGDTVQRGNSLDTRIPNITAIDLGTGSLKIKSVHSSIANLNCVVFVDSTVRCFGSNSNGQAAVVSNDNQIGDKKTEMGINLKTSIYTGTYTITGPMSITSFCAGDTMACSVFDNKKVKCWGSKYSIGESIITQDYISSSADSLGDNLSYINLGTNVGVEKISCGASHVCMKLDTGEIKCLGQNDGGQTGMGISAVPSNPQNILVPIPVGAYIGYTGNNLPAVKLGAGLQVLDLALGGAHSCVLLTGKKVKCFGVNNYGQLGYGNTTFRGSSPSDMGNNLPFVDLGINIQVASIHSGSSSLHNCVILSPPIPISQRIKCWGYSAYGQLGYGDQNNRGDEATEMGDNLLLVDLGTESRVKQLALGQYHTCALLISSDLKCFGGNGYGQLGSGSTAYISSTGNLMPFVQIDSGKTVKFVTAGNQHTCIVYDDLTTMKCIGNDQYGQLGQGNIFNIYFWPKIIFPNITNIDLGTGSLQIAAIYSGSNFNCVYFAYSSVKCFGANTYSQLANGKFNQNSGADFSTGKRLKFANIFSTSSQTTTLSPTKAPSVIVVQNDPTRSPTKASSAQQRFTWMNKVALVFFVVFVSNNLAIH